MMKLFRKILSLFVAACILFAPFSAFAEPNEEMKSTEKEALENNPMTEETLSGKDLEKLKKEKDELSKELLELKKELNVSSVDKKDEERKEVIRKRISVLEEKISDINSQIILLSGNTEGLKKLLSPTLQNFTNGKILETVDCFGQRFVPTKLQAEPFIDAKKATVKPEEFTADETDLPDVSDDKLSKSVGEGKGSGPPSPVSESQTPYPLNKEVTRQFLSFVTKSGKELHLIIDYTEGKNNVRLLTEVSEEDLLNMAIDTIPSDTLNRVKTEQEIETTKLQEEKERLDQEVQELTKELQKEKAPAKKSGNGIFILFLILMAVGIVGYRYFSNKRKENQKDETSYDDSFSDISEAVDEEKEKRDGDEFEDI